MRFRCFFSSYYQIMDNEVFVFWLENLCKLNRTRMVKMDEDTLQKPLRTDIAVRRYANPTEVSDALMRDAAG